MMSSRLFFPRANAPSFVLRSNLSSLVLSPYATVQADLVASNTTAGLVGNIPASIARLSRLEVLDLSHNSLSGTLPPGLALLENLQQISLNNNLLSGTVPSDWKSNATTLFDVSQNRLSGSLPRALPFNPYGTTLALNDNRFSGSLDLNSLLQRQASYTLRLQNNQLNGTIAPSQFGVSELVAANNLLVGTIPSLFVGSVDLSNNRLEGTLDALFINARPGHPFGGPFDSYLKLSNNRLSGTLPNPWYVGCLKIDLSYNFFSGPLPGLGGRVVDQGGSIILSHNNFSGTLPCAYAPSWAHAEAIDFSFNQLQFYPPLATAHSDPCLTSRVIDLSSNRFGEDNQHDLKQLSDAYKVLDRIILDNNPLNSPATSLNGFSGQVSAYNAGIYGTLQLAQTNITSLDLTKNNLDRALSLADLQQAMSKNLRSLSILHNPNIPPFESLDNVVVEKTEIPLSAHSYCNQLRLGESPIPQFFYDPSLFSYKQCFCDSGYYGVAPAFCYSCPAPLSTHCAGRQLNVTANSYIFFITDTPEELLNHTYDFPLGVEPCSDIGISSCRGVALSFYNTSYLNATTGLLPLSQQCAKGSRGRLCSECLCNSTDECYYSKGPICAKCKFVFTSTQSLLFIIIALIIILPIMTVALGLVLKSRRTRPTKSWDSLPRLKKIVYRVDLALSSSFARILVAFIQISAELTGWDSLGVKAWLQTSNLNLESVGLHCLLPFLSDPFVDLLSKLFLPIGACLLVVIASLIANFVLTFICGRCKRDKRSDDFKPFFSSDADHQSIQIVSDEDDRDYNGFSSTSADDQVEYPVGAFICSNLVSVLQFLYLGTATTALEPFFGYTQIFTNRFYLAHLPWLLFSDAKSHRLVAIPFLIFVVVGLPLAFLVVTFKLRHHLSSPRVTQYVGSLYARYRLSRPWWTAIDLLRKLMLALLLRCFFSSPVWRAGLVLFTLSVYSFLTVLFLPWKQRSENLLDVTSSAILIANYVTPGFINQYASPYQYPGLDTRDNSILIALIVLNGLFCLVLVGFWCREVVFGETSYHAKTKPALSSSMSMISKSTDSTHLSD